MKYDDFIISDEQAEKIAVYVLSDIFSFVKKYKENTEDSQNYL